MDMAHTVKTPLRRSFSEHVKDSTNKAWDVFWKSAREKRLSGKVIVGFSVVVDRPPWWSTNVLAA